MTPEPTAGLLTESIADWTVTPKLPTVATPVATWLNVHDFAVVSHAVVVVVRTNIVVPVNVTPAVSPVPPVQTTVGEEVRKKLDGKVMVIGSAPAAVSTLARAKPTVTTAEADATALAVRCAVVMAKVTPVNPSKPKELTDIVLR